MMKRPKIPKMKWKIVLAALQVIWRLAKEHVTVDKRDGEWVVCIHVPNNPFKSSSKKEDKADGKDAGAIVQEEQSGDGAVEPADR